jgi:hypothetical protein
MACCLPRRSKWLARMADPWVRLVDPIAGEAVGMRVDVDLEDGTTAAGVFIHKRLSDSVGCACMRHRPSPAWYLL